jgi:hypothetical protein
MEAIEQKLSAISYQLSVIWCAALRAASSGPPQERSPALHAGQSEGLIADS